MSNIINTMKYTELTNAVQAIKGAILQSQQRALAIINQEQLALYYGIGRFVSVNTRNKNWGKGFIEAISEQLRKELPGLRGFSTASLRKMRTFYEECQMLSDNSFVETNNLMMPLYTRFSFISSVSIVVVSKRIPSVSQDMPHISEKTSSIIFLSLAMLCPRKSISSVGRALNCSWA